MPIHLPPLTRRRFLAGALAAGAGLWLPRRLFAAQPDADPHTWALLSDIHLAADRAKIARDINMCDQFKAAALEVCQLARRPAAVLVCGDLAFNTGETADYAVVAELLKPLREAGLPIHLMLGNHDHRERFWAALTEVKAARRPVADRQAALIRSPRANWFVLDSLEETNHTPGLVGDAQRDWLARALDENKEQPAIVVVHHNLILPEIKTGILDSDRLLEIIRPRRQVKAFIYGHTHDWHVKQDESGIHLVNLPPTAYVFTAGKPSGWVQLALKPGGARLELSCLDKKHPAHGQVVDLQWRAA